MLFLVAGLVNASIAAVGVRRFAGGVRSFDSLRGLIAYIIFAVVLAPLVSASVAAFAGATQDYWFYWRVWFLSEGLGYLMLAPVLLTWFGAARAASKKVSFASFMEACLIACGLFAVCVHVFTPLNPPEVGIPALVYLPLPFLLWAAVRFGPLGVEFGPPGCCALLDSRHRPGARAFCHKRRERQCTLASTIPSGEFSPIDVFGRIDRGATREGECPPRERGTIPLHGEQRADAHLDVG